jgi:hypothetical protein
MEGLFFRDGFLEEKFAQDSSLISDEILFCNSAHAGGTVALRTDEEAIATIRRGSLKPVQKRVSKVLNGDVYKDTE